MTLLATFKHISSKNADYGAAEAYLTFEHDEFTMKATLDENGRLIPREDYRISSLNCGGEDFAVACMRANLRYEKNQKREDVKSHHYGIEDLEEAKQYLAHPVLGARLKEISEALLTLNTDNPYSVMGSIDALKLCSSMTLFAEIEGYDSVFGKVIFKFYSGKRDSKTIEILYSNHN